MKTLQKITKLSIIAMALFLVSCGSKDNNNAYVAPPQGSTSDSYVTGKVDGQGFSSDVLGTQIVSVSRINPGPDQFVTVLGGDLAGNSITISIAHASATGTFNVNKDTESFLNYSPGSGGIAYATSAACSTAQGTIVVTYVDNSKIEGTFSFTGVNTEDCAGGTKTITEGSFRGTFTN